MSTPERKSPFGHQVTRATPAEAMPAVGDTPRHGLVPILNAGRCVVASIPGAVTDSMLLRLRDEVLAHLVAPGARGVVIDVEAVDVLDSFTVHVLNTLAQMAALHNASVVITGLRADLSTAMARLGVRLQGMTVVPTVMAGLASFAEGSEPCARAGA